MKNYLFVIFILLTTNCFSQIGNWYKGDLHSHSTYSDGTSSVHDIISDAENKGFTFYVLTDHDNIYTSSAGSLLHWSDTAYYSNNMILLYGVEWTTDNGHACIWNSQPFDYDSIFQYNLMNDPSLAERIVNMQGGLFSINHPLNLALLWQYSYDFTFQGMEILNGPYSYLLSNNNYVITDSWEPLLQSGKRITAVGGSDMHHLNDWFPSIYPNLGSPTTWIYSEQATSDGIIDGIRRGHVCISNSPDEPHLDFFADSCNNNSFDYMMGDNVMDTNSAITFKVNLIGSQGNYSFRVIKNGISLYSQPISISGANPSVIFSDIPGQRSFYRVELLSNGEPVSWTNPIYFGYDTQNILLVNQLSEISESDIFPNPAKDFVYIRNRAKEELNISIFNINGTILFSKVSKDEIIRIGLEKLSSGVYFIKTINSKSAKTFKVIKQ